MTVSSIETAPMDGTAILTNCGFARHVNEAGWGCPVTGGWVECDPFGNIYNCVEDGWWYCHPTKWQPVPDWILQS